MTSDDEEEVEMEAGKRTRPEVFNSASRTLVGTSGFTNYIPGDQDAALKGVWEKYPTAVVVDGVDNWMAPAHKRGAIVGKLVETLALFHTGVSGISMSGFVIEAEKLPGLEAAYLEEYGVHLSEFMRVYKNPVQP